MFTYKIDEQLSLKLLDLHDTQQLFQLTDTSRKHLKQWLPWLNSTTTMSDTETFIRASLNGFSENKMMNTAILYNNEMVGLAGYNSIDQNNKIAYIGYWLGENHQGKGIMTTVVEALTNYAFVELKLNRVEIRAAIENKKSRAIPERLGFINEGRIRQAEWLYDHYVDHVVYSILSEEWNTR